MVKNPLSKRFFRELKGDPGKYAVIFFMMVLSIAAAAGVVVANDSMSAEYEESFEKYNIEDGRFTTENKMSKAQKKRVEDLGVSLYDNFYCDVALTNGNTMRFYKNREDVDLICLMEGRFPKTAGETAIDRMHADNNSLKIGDTLSDGTHTWTITGFVAFSDYSTMFEKNSDTMFDAIRFGTAVLTDDGFDFGKSELTYSYSWKYDDPPADKEAAGKRSEDFLEELAKEVVIEDYIPRYENQAIVFAGDDISGDSVMMQVLIYIIIVIMAFVFAVIVSNTIQKESAVIGTLKATGYTDRELLRHYMSLPVAVTFISAVIGNILGYTLIKNYVAGMYYNSYSLTPYTTRWNGKAFIQTTVIPIIIMFFVNFIMIRTKLRFSPLQFLKRDFKKKRSRGSLKLPSKIPFFTRFRIRVFFQNIGNYIVLFVGILFANFILFFGFIFTDVMDSYENSIQDMMFCDYQYILTIPSEALSSDSNFESMINLAEFESEAETDNPDAEKFSAYSLETLEETGVKVEEVTLYGVKEDSRYINLNLSPGDIYISSAFADKYGIAKGDTFTLKESYEEDRYDFTVTGIYDYRAGISIFMPQSDLNEMFDLGKNTFSGYFSDSPITDIDEKYIGSYIDRGALTKLTRQLKHSFEGMLNIVYVFSISIFVVLVYLLSKTIIEKNGQSISMTKILGYRNIEISSLYILTTSVFTVIFILLSFPVCSTAMEFIYRKVMGSMINGWIFFEVSPVIWVKMFLLGVGTYIIVAVFEYIKITKIPMDEALKNVE